ncbi:hypothetical protein [Rickettsiales endosymbiont of Stachyamoeba lipophora]|nr:hypothetical protein [Rickettsiales endosymbiont of Stachyamoeba lipophora]
MISLLFITENNLYTENNITNFNYLKTILSNTEKNDEIMALEIEDYYKS